MEHDWPKSDERLHEAALSAIQTFAKEHRNTEICCFFFDCDDPQYGLVHISLDSIQNNMRSAKQLEHYAIERRNRNLKGKNLWQSAKHQLTSPVLSPFNTNGGDFEFGCYRTVDFPAWRELAESKDIPQTAEHEDDYLASNARLVMWRVAEKLISEDAFAPLSLASPFMVGYSVHDEEEAILRLLNWPRSAQQDAPPNGGPAASLGNSGTGGGPPSVS
ncbi:MAG: hypothetical protein ACXWKH_18590 [Limisphaerales bacterium]